MDVETVDRMIKDSRRHGQVMYCQGLEHAIKIIELGGEDAIEFLKNKLAERKKEIKKEFGE